MKAISLWQPWATLIAIGAKKYETRSWATPYRGPLLICASKGGIPKDELLDILAEPEFRDVLTPALLNRAWPPVQPHHLPFGKALCVVDLVDCIRTGIMTPEQIGTDELFGDFSPGRFAWRLENVRAFKEPLSIRGKQGLFDVDDRIVQEAL